MAFFSSRPFAPLPVTSGRPAAHVANPALLRRLSAVYAACQHSKHVFASPLGPFESDGAVSHVPRFVYFGSHASDESQRIAFFAGFDANDLRGTLSLLRFIEWLAADPEVGKGLALSFFPLVDALGAFQGKQDRRLTTRPWPDASVPEIELLEKEVRARGYHGFVRLESTPAGEDALTVRVRGLRQSPLPHANVELISTEDTEPLPARFEVDPRREAYAEGPLSVSDDLPFAPFEITFGLPVDWTEAAHRAAVCTVLRRFIRRYRRLHAYGQHL